MNSFTLWYRRLEKGRFVFPKSEEGRSELTNYLKDGRIEIDNNLIENAIRPFALDRKNWILMGSPRGAKAGAILYSLIETCKANQVEPYQYFCAMLHRLRHCKTDDDYKNLLPQFIQL